MNGSEAPPHYEVLSALLPKLLDGWLAFHDAVVGGHALSDRDRDFVWIVVVAACRVPTGARHVREFLECGGTTLQVEAAASLGAAVLGCVAFDAIGAGWRGAAPEMDLEASYLRGIEHVAREAGIEPRLCHLSMAAAHAACQSWGRLRLHLRAARRLGVTDETLAQSLAMVIMPAGMPVFVGACSTWLRMAEAGELDAASH